MTRKKEALRVTEAPPSSRTDLTTSKYSAHSDDALASAGADKDNAATPAILWPAGSMNAEDIAEISRLAALPPIDYDRQRKTAAKKSGCTVRTLDKLVEKARGESKPGDLLQGNAVKLARVKPWGAAVEGCEVLDAVADVFRQYIALSPHEADALALWCAHAHIFDAFRNTPRLNITAPEKGCGKTTLLDVIELFMPLSVRTENLTVAVLFRVIDQFSPVILADEYDTWLTRTSDKSEELRGLLNAGHSATGGGVWRCVGDDNELRQFKAHSPAVLCGIGPLPGTLQDRSIIIRLARAKPGEIETRFDPSFVEAERVLCRKLARWCKDNRSRISEFDPELPEIAHNRLADNWRPLFKIAAITQRNWPDRCVKAFEYLTGGSEDGTDGTRLHLLADIKEILGTRESVYSSELCDALNNLDESPWKEKRNGHGLNSYLLAKWLKQFGIRSKSIWRELTDGRRASAIGYLSENFTESFSRYLPA
jgi:putative DNA primase/helicase